jgi:hypothetical protein
MRRAMHDPELIATLIATWLLAERREAGSDRANVGEISGGIAAN